MCSTNNRVKIYFILSFLREWHGYFLGCHIVLGFCHGVSNLDHFKKFHK